ncbi:hypothetical protein COLO4_26365 [Corchorus olitorius]|uniref:Uncharacterized protein n=1 Tax=Corchorus olitorius TaxID=93759 RepID=A0A1R3HXT7_9ROSI|nr:hypothetical protein COLO4_26365 [Corchorus olitorius]
MVKEKVESIQWSFMEEEGLRKKLEAELVALKANKAYVKSKPGDILGFLSGVGTELKGATCHRGEKQ